MVQNSKSPRAMQYPEMGPETEKTLVEKWVKFEENLEFSK